MLGNVDQSNKDDDLEDEDLRAVQPKLMPDPGAPSRQEILEHEMTHIPFRVWCPHCIAARAKSMKHIIEKYKDEHRLPSLGLDYAFLNKTDNANLGISSITTLVAKDSKSKYLFGIPVPRKGLNEEEYATRMLLRAIQFLGYGRLILKSDQEPAIVKVLEHVRDHRGEETTQIAIEHSPAYE